MFDTRLITIGAVGTGIQSWVLPGSYQIAGIKIDNKSGSWLLLSDGTFIPPYTLDFGHSFQPTVASLNVLFANGPAGQVSTQQGDNPIVTIYSEPVNESPGVPSGLGKGFIEQFTPIVSTSTTILVPTSTGVTSQIVLAAITNRRFRVLTVDTRLGALWQAPPNPDGQYDSGLIYSIFGAPSFTSIARGRLRPDHIIDHHIFPLGLDLVVGDSINATVLVDWADVSFGISFTTQTI